MPGATGPGVAARAARGKRAMMPPVRQRPRRSPLRWSLRGALLLLVLLGAAATLAACGRSDSDADVIVDGSVVPPGAGETGPDDPAPDALPVRPTAPDGALDPERPTGFGFPLAGACLPGSDNLMPNAPRPYRNGVHEGLDFYHFSSCVPVAAGTAVYAMFDGVVVRADLDYVDITAQQVEELAAKTAAQGFSDPQTLDIYRGRQVWIDHGDGIVTRYAHLGSIEPGIAVGVEVRRGQLVGGVGESGTPESITAPGTEMHLHAEVRIGDSFLGAGLPPGEVRRLYARLFGVEAGDGAADDAPADDAPGDAADDTDAPSTDTGESTGETDAGDP